MLPPLAIITISAIIVAILIGVIIQAFSMLKKERRETRKLSAQKKVLLDQDHQNDETERELRRERNWFHLLFNSTEDIVFVYGVTEDGLPGTLQEVNDEACRRLGYSRDDLLSKTIIDIQESDNPIMSSSYSKSEMAGMSDSSARNRTNRMITNIVRKQLEQIVNKGRLVYETSYENRNGEPLPVEVRASVFELFGETLIMAAASDITQRQEAGLELRESKLSFRDFFANSPIGIAMYNSDKVLSDVNLACLKMFGIPDREQFSRFNLFNNPFIPAEAMQKINKGESARYEAVVNFGEAIEKSVFISRKTGTSYYDIQINNMGPGEDFRPRGYFAQVQDISERRRTENELTQSQEHLRQAEKMEAIGSMAGGIAHDFNNILTPIIGYAQMLQSKFPDDPMAGKFAKGILKAANRAKDLVTQILTFSRKSDAQDEQNFHPIHIIPIVKEVLVLQRTTLPDTVEIDRIIKTESDVVVADPTKIHQILMNLCTNAGHAMRETGGGILEVRLTEFTHTGRSKGDLRDLNPGRYLRISVKDAGTGMEKAVMDRIFEPFFTTKKKGEGTGMGLSVVHGIVSSFNGTITVESELGSGSTFHVILPTVETAAQEDADAESQEMPEGSESILVVDDDVDVCEMTTDMLVSLGYETASSNHANGAMRLFSIDPGKFDLVITDQVMPGMSGTDLSKKLLELKPELPIILCTGYSNKVSEEQVLEIGIKAFMTKPLQVDQLAKIIRDLLDGKELS